MKFNKLMINIFYIVICIIVFFGYIFGKFGILKSEFEKNMVIIIISIFAFFTIDRSKIKINSDIKLWILFLIYASMNLIFSVDTYHSGSYIVMIIALLFMKVVLYNINEEEKNNILKTIQIFSGIHVAITIIYFIFPEAIQSICKIILIPEVYTYNVNLYKYGCISGICPDHGANAVFISIFLSIASANVLKKTSTKRVFLLLAGIIALLLTGKRGPLIANIVAFAIMFLHYNKSNKKRIKSFFIVSSAFAILIAIVTMIPETKFVFERFEKLSESDNVLNGRDVMYPILINNFLEHFFFGNGIRSTLLINNGNDGHDIYLQILSELGLTGALIIFPIFIINIIKVLRGKKDEKKENFMLFALYYQIFFLIYGISGNPFYYIPTMVIYFIATTL